ncbi:MAG TPA: hypothetical protein VKQ05_05615 [Gemmatimonadales bacterium]|nr:hypothetical protein [Gemmatimonadales bacterium]
MKEIMLKRIPLAILLALQVFGSGAVSLAEARDVVIAPSGIEAGHTARCAILHDEMRCALCHYASTRVAVQPAFTLSTPNTAVHFTPVQSALPAGATVLRTAPPRGPPPALS